MTVASAWSGHRAEGRFSPQLALCSLLAMAPMIGESWSYPESHTFAELLIDCEEDRTLRAVLVGMLRETEW